MRASGLALVTAGLLALEGAALLVIAGIEALGLAAGGAAEVPTALALVVLTVIGGAGLIGFAIAVLRGNSWGRSGGMVLQILGVAIALSALSVEPRPTTFILALSIPCAIGIVLLLLLSRRAGAAAKRVAAGEPGDDAAA